MTALTVHLGERSYPIAIVSGALDQLGTMARESLGACKCAVVTDTNVAPLYLARAEASLRATELECASVVLPAGEQTKSLDVLRKLYDFFCREGITRRDAVIALGGGVIGDVTGLAAATFLRGIAFVQVPTSLLAQVDSSVGGKVAVDLPQGKNLVGAFYQPRLVALDPDTLHTLPAQIWRDGMGEVVKYGCILDAELFSLLERLAPQGRDALAAHMDEILLHCLRAKISLVEKDERDTGERILLNFGHTLGHAAEAAQGYGGLRHGEAVALGMAAITRMSEADRLTAPGTSARLESLLRTLSLPVHLAGITPEALLAPLRMDKKNSGKTLRVILLRRIGESYVYETTAERFTEIKNYV